jgi:ribosomal small subunit protein bTHX
MGRGDKKSKKGKIRSGSYGVSRPRPSLLAKAKAASATNEAKPKKEKAAPKEAKPAAVKKTTKKKTEE